MTDTQPQNLKIAMISFHTCPLAAEEGKETGGMNVYVLELGRQLAAQGHQVDLITRCQDPSNQRIVPVAPNLRVIHLLAGPPAPVPKKELGQFIPEFIDRLNILVTEENTQYDIVHAHYYWSGLIAQAWKQQLSHQPPVVMTFHTLALLKNLVARTESEQEESLRIETEYQLVAEADHVVTPSLAEESYLQYLYQANPNRVTIIPPGVNTELFRPQDKCEAKAKIGVDREAHVLLFVGRVEPLKGVDALLYAAKIVRARRSDLKIQVLIVGGDVSQPLASRSAEHQKLEKVRHYLHIPDMVTFVGQQHQSQLPDYYNAAEVVVMPSHYESFGMAALEAMACGTPVITTNVAGISSLITEVAAPVVTSVNNPLLLADQIEELLDEHAHTPALTKQLVETAQLLSWDRVAQQMSSLYYRLIARK